MYFLETSKAFFEIFIRDEYYMTLLNGVKETLIITLIATIVGLIIGSIIAVIQVSEFPKNLRWLEIILKKIAKIYIDLIRGTPAMAQIMFLWLVVFSVSPLHRSIVGGISFGINSGAYMAELIRAGIQGVDKGQFEAARSLGLGYKETMQFIIMPQALKQMLPALVNEFIVLIKETAIIGTIGGVDIMRAGNIMITQTGNVIIPMILVCLTYLVLTGIFTKIMRIVERKITTN
ncbi:MAG: amino acid ABC transporter permease [Cellulosilyticaceae bacterium]